MKICTVVGARPQFIKAAMVSRAIAASEAHIKEEIIHTGQHFDANMSDVFFEDMGIPVPTHHLGIGGGTHGQMTGQMLIRLEEVFYDSTPDAVLVYGDTNSTLSGALAASKMHIPVIHVEAGLRSRNRLMPEEQNRVLTDHLADLLLCPTDGAVRNLEAEGMTKGVVRTGDVMYDAALHYATNGDVEMSVTLPETYILLTLHRAENTDNVQRLRSILSAINSSQSLPIVFPVHPRTRKALDREGLELEEHVIATDPVGYLQMIRLERDATAILTDSGGVQKEAYFFKKPCGTLRDETEWTETVETGANTLLGAYEDSIKAFVKNPPLVINWPDLYGQGRAAQEIVRAIEDRLLA